MTTSLLLLLASCMPGAAGTDNQSPFEQALTEDSQWVYRAQSPSATPTSSPLVGPPQGMSTYYPPAYPSNDAQSFGGTDPFSSPAAPTYPSPIQDPWAGGTQQPYLTPMPGPGGFYTFGTNGVQPLRYGWTDRIDLQWIPKQGTNSPSTGDFAVFGVDIEKTYVTPLGKGWTGSIAPQFNYRSWQGPNGSATIDMPADVYRFGLDMNLMSPSVGGWAFEVGFDPSLAADFNSSLTSDAWLFDAHAVAFWQMTPRWMWVLGALYWDRVDNIVLPYAGAVWTPNDIWEFRLVFPKPRVSVFVGTPWGIPTWLYAAGEYHVEAYQVKPQLFPSETRVQLADWRVTGGVRWETGRVNSYLEAGYILGRKVKYDSIGNEFNIDSGFIGQLGFRF